MLHARRGDVAASLGEKGVQAIYDYADVLHCDPIEKAADDTITEFSLQGGGFDNVSAARYAVPGFDNVSAARYAVPDVWTVGKVYARLIEDVSGEDNVVETLLKVYTSWIDEKLSDYNSSFYYESRDYIAECWRQGEALDG